MIPAYAQAFTYRILWRSQSLHSGLHRGARGGLGMEFHGNVPLTDYPDARRIDLTQTLRDPMDQLHVRVFNQKNPTTVFAVCDLSGSMQFAGHRDKLARAAEIAASIAYSAYRNGDPFGFVGFDDVVREDWLTPLSRRMHEAFELTSRLMGYRPADAGAEGLQDVSRYLGSARALVFLISDFHMPPERLEEALNTLSRHHVVPLVLWDSAEYRELPRLGFSAIVDPETGVQRTLLFRRALRERFEQAFAERRALLEALFLRYEIPPCFIDDAFRAEALTEYFHQFSAR